MEEKTLIKSERSKIILKYPLISGSTVGIVVLYALIDVFRLRSEAEYAMRNFGYSNIFQYILKVDALFHLLVCFIFPASILFFLFMYILHSKTNLTVTDKRIYGNATFGKFVDIPIGAFNCCELGSMSGIKIVSSYGEYRFSFISNAQDISRCLFDLCSQKKTEVNVRYDKNNMMDIDDLKEKILKSVRTSLKSPITAVLCDFDEMVISERNGQFVIKGYVSSQNGFGAMVKTDFSVVASYEDSWSIIRASVGLKTVKNIAKTFTVNYILILFMIGIGTIVLLFLFSLF